MKEATLANSEAPVKWWAASDARMRSIVNSTHYSDEDKLRAERMKASLGFMFQAKAIYIAYGKKGVSIKVDKPIVKNLEGLASLEAIWDEQGVSKRVSAQGITYRFSA